MANSPTYKSYRTNSQNITNSGSGVSIWRPETIPLRILTCMAVWISGQNPDGTAWGS